MRDYCTASYGKYELYKCDLITTTEEKGCGRWRRRGGAEREQGVWLREDKGRGRGRTRGGAERG